ncbi:Hypothetical protein, putative, partial [Bodo saltans]
VLETPPAACDDMPRCRGRFNLPEPSWLTKRFKWEMAGGGLHDKVRGDAVHRHFAVLLNEFRLLFTSTFGDVYAALTLLLTTVSAGLQATQLVVQATMLTMDIAVLQRLMPNSRRSSRRLLIPITQRSHTADPSDTLQKLTTRS